MSIEAITWVLRYAPNLAPHLVTPLLVFADSADEFGRHSYPAVETVAFYSRKDKRAARRDVDSLEELKLLIWGDQSRVAHLPADRRPVVYDLPIDRLCPDRVDFLAKRKERRFARRPSTNGRSPRPSRNESEGVQEPSREASEGVRETRREGSHVTGEGVCGPSDPFFDPSSESPLLSRPDDRHALLAGIGVPEDEKDRLIRKIEEKHRPKGLGWWRAVAANGDLVGIVRDARAAVAADPTRVNPNPFESGQLVTKPSDDGVCPRCRNRGWYADAPGCTNACPDCKAGQWWREANT